MTDQQITARETQNVDNEITIDLKDVMLRLLGRWKLIIGVSLALALAVGIYTAMFVTPLYKATSTIYVLNKKESSVNMSDLQVGSALTKDYVKVFDMWAVQEQVITNLNLPYDYAQLHKMLKVSIVPDTRMLDISVYSPSPKEAAMISNEYAEVASQYIAETMATDKPSIMSVALEPNKPVSPNVVKNGVLGFILGFVVTAGIVIVQIIMDDSYKTAEDIRKYTGLVTLAVIPVENDMGSKMDKKTRRQR